jgi:peptidyl-prolyl cis-trans isomerase C
MLLASRIVTATALVALSASACNDRALNVDGAAADAGHRGSGAISPEQASKVLAHVGDRTITLGDYVASLQHMDQFDRLRYQSPERRRELLKDMINIQILADEAVAKGYDKDPLAQQEVRSILRNAMMEQARAGAPTSNAIPEAEVHAYFDAHRDEFKDPERRRISVIVVADDKSARAVLESATKTPTSIHWGELVRTKSVDAAAKANVPVDLAGDFGMVTPPGVTIGENGRVPEEVREATFRIPEVGGVYDKPVKSKTDSHVYLVRLTQKTDAHERTYAESERSIRVKLVQDKVREREDDLLTRLRAEYPVQIDDAVLATVNVDLGDAGANAPSAPDSPPVAAPPPDAGKRH